MTFHVSLFHILALKLIENKLQSLYLRALFTALQSDAQRESYEDFPTITSLRLNLGA